MSNKVIEICEKYPSKDIYENLDDKENEEKLFN